MARGLQSLPAAPETVGMFVGDLSQGHKPATIQLAVAAISQAHQLSGFDPPTRNAIVREILKGARREIGTAQRQAKAALKEDIWRILAALPEDLRGKRDRALILIGFGAALRRSELVALDLADLQETDRGLTINIRKSKTDQTAEGRQVAIPRGRTPETCAANALRLWLEASNIAEGAIFRSISRHGKIRERMTPQSIALVIKERIKAAGIDPTMYSGHSLRAGLATSAALAGATESAIARQTGHRSTAMVRKYVRVADMWRDNAAEKVGL